MVSEKALWRPESDGKAAKAGFPARLAARGAADRGLSGGEAVWSVPDKTWSVTDKVLSEVEKTLSVTD